MGERDGGLVELDAAVGWSAFERAVVLNEPDAAVILADIGNIQVAPILPELLQELTGRVRSRVRDTDLIGYVGDDQIGVLVTGLDDDAVGAMASRVGEIFNEPVLVNDQVVRLHGTVVWVSGTDKLMWRVQQANAAAVEQHHRRIITEGIWDAPGLESARTLEQVAMFGDVCAPLMGMEALELVADGRRHVRPGGVAPDREPDGRVPVRVQGKEIGWCAWWFRAGAVVPTHPQYFSAMSLSVSDAVERILRAEEAEWAATHDPLTGLLNRRGLDAGIRSLTGSYAVALIDLDDFKGVNTRLGLHGGDATLVAFAQLLSEQRPGDLTGRWGGEEFLLVLPGVGAEGAAARMGRLLQRVSASIDVGAGNLTFSCGVTCSAGNADVSGLVDEAERGLIVAKRSGKAQVVIVPAQRARS